MLPMSPHSLRVGVDGQVDHRANRSHLVARELSGQVMEEDLPGIE